MEIRKGPYGHYAVQKIEDINSINNYTREIIEENIPGNVLPMYIIPTISSYEVSFEFSGLFPLKECNTDDTENINKLRKALGDLFLFIAELPDMLLFPSSVILDERYIFTDQDYEKMYVCFDPVMKPAEELNIHSLKRNGIERFINSPSVASLLLPGESDGMIYAIELNDKDMFIREAKRLTEPIKAEQNGSVLYSLPEMKLVILASLLSLIFMLVKLPWVSLFFVSAEILFAYRTYRKIKCTKEVTIHTEADSTKRQMLFGDENEKGSSIDAVILTSRDTRTGIEEKKAIYTDKAVIGSDRFLCDIFNTDEGISPVHAKITRNGRTYYVSDLSSDNSTFLNNVRLLPGKDYEIKSDQTLICGKREYRIEIV